MASPLPFIDSDYEKKVDENSETHSYHDPRHFQPAAEFSQSYYHLKLLLHVQQLGQTVGVRHLPRVEQADVHGEDEDPADVVPDGGHLEDGVGHQSGDVDNAAENPDDQYAPPLTGYQC